MRSFFVTATDTGIGKTSITAGLAHLLHESRIDVGVMKPFATGIPQKSGFKSEDAQILAKASQVQDAEELINPYFFPISASPYLAAAKLGLKIDIDVVLEQFEILQSKHDAVLVEGIGGIMTPILKDYFVADLIKDMGLEIILVTSSRIGTINHTLLTCDACKKYGLKIRGMIINGSNSDGYDLDDLADDLKHLSGIDVLDTIPHFGQFDIGIISEHFQGSNILSKLTF